MKKLVLSISILLLSVVSYSQITLLKEVEGKSTLQTMGGFDFKEFTGYYLQDEYKFTIYDENLNIVKVLNMPTGYSPYSAPTKNVYTSIELKTECHCLVINFDGKSVENQ